MKRASTCLMVALCCHSCAGNAPKQAGSQQAVAPVAPAEEEVHVREPIAHPARGELLSRPVDAPGAPGGAQPASNVVTTETGLQYEDLVVGNGPTPQGGQTVTVHYTGWLTNGSKFDSSLDKGQPFQFVLGAREVIRGWDEGVATMRVGGRRRLMVPPQLGYGERGAGGVIPPNATLIFEVELLGVQ